MTFRNNGLQSVAVNRNNRSFPFVSAAARFTLYAPDPISLTELVNVPNAPPSIETDPDTVLPVAATPDVLNMTSENPENAVFFLSLNVVGIAPSCESRFAAANPTAVRMFAAVVCVAAFVACVAAVAADDAAELADALSGAVYPSVASLVETAASRLFNRVSPIAVSPAPFVPILVAMVPIVVLSGAVVFQSPLPFNAPAVIPADVSQFAGIDGRFVRSVTVVIVPPVMFVVLAGDDGRLVVFALIAAISADIDAPAGAPSLA